MPTSYETSLKDILASDAVDVFIDTWGQAVTRRILGEVADTEAINAIVDLDNEDDGQSIEYEQRDGERILRRGLLEVEATQEIDRRDTFVINGEVWAARRIQSRDDGMKSVTIVLAEGQTTRQARTRAV